MGQGTRFSEACVLPSATAPMCLLLVIIATVASSTQSLTTGVTGYSYTIDKMPSPLWAAGASPKLGTCSP
jgi:hypothetical protein